MSHHQVTMTQAPSKEIKPREYQGQAIQAITQAGSGRWLVQMATGLGKTVTFALLPRQGRTLILSHRDELVRQPIKYYDCPVGIEKAGETSDGEPVVSASIQSLRRRLDKFAPDEFDTIITDECHHAAAKTYRDVIAHFKPRVHLGFTATPTRGDEVGLDDIYDEIIFSRDLVWGIENGWLARLKCLRADIGYDITDIATRLGDYAQNELSRAMNINSINHGVAEAFEKHAEKPAIIFAVDVAHAQAIAELIPGAMVLHGKTRPNDRKIILHKFKTGQIPCIVNCAILTEGTDLPNARTIIVARPTKSKTLYTQMVGRGLRKTDDKTECLLIDCVGAGQISEMCTAPTLIGYDIDSVPNPTTVHGDLIFDIPKIIKRESDTPQSWIKNTQIVTLWARRNKYSLHDVDWFKNPDGSLMLGLPRGTWFRITPPDQLQNATLTTGVDTFTGKVQELLDVAFKILKTCYINEQGLWRKSRKAAWKAYPATERQKQLITQMKIDIDINAINKADAGKILTRRFGQ